MNTRIAGYDFARSLALFGLVVANFSESVKHTDYGLSHLVQARLQSLIQGGVVTTFLVLGGVGILLLTQRVRITNDAHAIADNRKRLIKRAASLLVVGICCNLIWQENFLCFYSICILIGALLLTVSNRWLWSLAFVFVVIFVVFIFFVYNYFNYYEVLLNRDVLRDTNPWTLEGMVFRLYFYRLNWILSWTVFLLIGMWLGRQAVHQPRVRRDMLIRGIVVALAAECALWLPYGVYPIGMSEWSSEDILFLLLAISFFTNAGIAFAIIGGSLMLTEKYPDAKWTKPFVATGQFALTLYIAHLIVGRGILEGLGFLENQTFPFAIGIAVIFCICAVMFSHFWRKRFDRGPLEWGMRRITG